jgi:hypothetical protein
MSRHSLTELEQRAEDLANDDEKLDELIKDLLSRSAALVERARVGSTDRPKLTLIHGGPSDGLNAERGGDDVA